MIMVLSKPRLEVSGGESGAAAELERRRLDVASRDDVLRQRMKLTLAGLRTLELQFDDDRVGNGGALRN